MLVLKDITKKYGDLTVIKNISFQVSNNEIVAIIGPSGCGKSTILNIISGLLAPDIGFVVGTNDSISFVFQDDRLLPWRTVWQNISIVNDKVESEKIKNLIKAVGLEGFEHYYPNQLSGGMKKRCGIARAFYFKSDFLLMDEPFQGLDYRLRQDMLTMLLKVWKVSRQGIIFVTHDIDEALTVASSVIVLSGRPSKIVKKYTLPSYKKRGSSVTKMKSIRNEIIKMISEEKTIKKQ